MLCLKTLKWFKFKSDSGQKILTSQDKSWQMAALCLRVLQSCSQEVLQPIYVLTAEVHTLIVCKCLKNSRFESVQKDLDRGSFGRCRVHIIFYILCLLHLRAYVSGHLVSSLVHSQKRQQCPRATRTLPRYVRVTHENHFDTVQPRACVKYSCVFRTLIQKRFTYYIYLFCWLWGNDISHTHRSGARWVMVSEAHPTGKVNGPAH